MTSPYNDPIRPRPGGPADPGAPGDPYPAAPYADPGVPVAGDRPLGEEAAAEASYQRYREEDRSLGEIASDLLDNASTLIRQEVDLAKAELSQSASKAGKGAGLLAAAGVAALMALIALTLMLWWALAVLIGSDADPALGWSGLIVTIIWLVIAAILAVVGRGELAKVRGLPKTTDTVKKIPNAATGHEEKNR